MLITRFVFTDELQYKYSTMLELNSITIVECSIIQSVVRLVASEFVVQFRIGFPLIVGAKREQAVVSLQFAEVEPKPL